MNKMHTIEIMPSEDTIIGWVESFIPDYDLYFVDEQLLARLDHFSGLLLIPREEFNVHPIYREISSANAYTYWTVDQIATHVVHAPQEWLKTLSDTQRIELLTYQVKVGRGLIFSISEQQLSSRLNRYIVQTDMGKYFVVQRSVWELMTEFERHQLMMNYAKEWDSWTVQELPSEAPDHLKKYANTFTTVAGGNCLAATLFAVTEADWVLTQWVHPKTFLETLAYASYVEVDAIAMKGDVLTFWDDAGRLQHATYRIDDKLFFNKNGQTMFNPWKVIDETELFAAWGTLTTKTYRQTK